MNPQPEEKNVGSGDMALAKQQAQSAQAGWIIAAEVEPMVVPMEQPQPTEDRWLGITRTAWLQMGILALLFFFTFYQASLRRLWLKTNPFNGEPNWSHAVCVPIIGLYYLYANRRSLLRCVVRQGWSGLPVLIAGLLLFGYGIYPGQNDMVKDLGMVMTLFGLAAFLLGWEMMKIVWFPIAFLVCAIPWPGLVYSWVAGPLQLLAADMAVVVLKTTGVAALGDGTKIIIDVAGGESRTLNVAEACAGLRSLMTFITIGAAIAFLSSRPLWQKIVITISAVPIAIFCNVMRVCGQGLLDHYWGQQWSQDFAHQFAGMVMLIPAFFLLLLVGWMLDKLFIEVIDESDPDASPMRALVIEASMVSATPLPRAAPPATRHRRATQLTVARPVRRMTSKRLPAAPPSMVAIDPASVLSPNAVDAIPPASGENT